MRVAVLGSGLMGGKLGTIFARAGHEVVFSYSRSRAKLEKLARETGGNAAPQRPRVRCEKRTQCSKDAEQYFARKIARCVSTSSI